MRQVAKIERQPSPILKADGRSIPLHFTLSCIVKNRKFFPNCALIGLPEQAERPNERHFHGFLVPVGRGARQPLQLTQKANKGFVTGKGCKVTTGLQGGGHHYLLQSIQLHRRI